MTHIFTDQEAAAILELAKLQGCSPEKIIVQALRHYQLEVLEAHDLMSDFSQLSP